MWQLQTLLLVGHTIFLSAGDSKGKAFQMNLLININYFRSKSKSQFDNTTGQDRGRWCSTHLCCSESTEPHSHVEEGYQGEGEKRNLRKLSEKLSKYYQSLLVRWELRYWLQTQRESLETREYQWFMKKEDR